MKPTNKIRKLQFGILPLAAALPIAFHCPVIQAEEMSRGDKWEIAASGLFMTEGNLTITSPIVAPVHYGNLTGGGLSFGYNLSDNWNLNLALAGGTVAARTVLLGTAVNSRAVAFNTDLNVDYNILKSRLTPFVTGGVNVGYFGDQVSTANARLQYVEPLIGFGGGGGLRWDVTDHAFIKAGYRLLWRSGIGDVNSASFISHEVTLGVGFKF